MINERLKGKEKILKGIEDGRRAFCGPSTVQIDLTDHCGLGCMPCWVHSPLLDEKDIFKHGKKILSFDAIKKAVEELAVMEAKSIVLAGSGEPLLYPKILDVVNLIKSKGFYLTIVTNALLLDENTAKQFIRAGVDLIVASVWAADSQTYGRIHAGAKEGDFRRVADNLKRFSFIKGKAKKLAPHLKVYNVIYSQNYDQIDSLINFARYVDADSVEFWL